MHTNHTRLSDRVRLAIALLLLASSALHAGNDWGQTIRKMERQGVSKAQLAIAYNNYALELTSKNEWNKAEANLKKAMRTDPKNRQFKKNLAAVYMNHANAISNDGQSRSQAIKLANRALQYRPDWMSAYLLIGDLEYADQRLQRAELAWKKADRLQPGSRKIADRLKRLARESSVETELNRGGNAHFNMRYQQQLSDSAADELLAGLMKARQEIGRQFGYWPDRRIVVLIYSPAGFRQIRRGPEWVAGVYDGKIRVQYPYNELEATLIHEYTHAVVRDLAGTNCPKWLNEGMAQLQETRIKAPPLQTLRMAARTDSLLPIDQLDSAFSSDDAVLAGLGYRQSYSIVHYLAETFPFHKIVRVMQHLGRGDGLDASLKRELFIDSRQLEANWKEWLPSFLN